MQTEGYIVERPSARTDATLGDAGGYTLALLELTDDEAREVIDSALAFAERVDPLRVRPVRSRWRKAVDVVAARVRS